MSCFEHRNLLNRLILGILKKYPGNFINGSFCNRSLGTRYSENCFEVQTFLQSTFKGDYRFRKLLLEPLPCCYLFKVNNKNTRTMCEIFSKFMIKTIE